MKRIVMFIKISFIGLSLAILSGIIPVQQERVSAQNSGCSNTACVDRGWIFSDCQCTNSSCSGCYIQNGTSGCGVCSRGGGAEIILD